MRFDFRLSRIQRIGLALLALIGAGLACGTGNISPSNPELQGPVVGEGLAFIEYLNQIGVLDPGEIAPWIVEPASPPFGGGIITFQGWGPTQANLKSNDLPVITLHEILPNGCDDTYILGREIGSTTMSGNSNSWSIPNVLVTSDTDVVVGAVVKSDGHVGPVSNLLNFNSYAIDVSIEKPGPNEQFMAKVDFEGTASSGQCLELWRGDQIQGEPVAADKNGLWKIPSVRTLPGENIFTLKVRLPGTASDYAKEVKYKVQGPIPPQFVWPFGTMEGTIYKPDTEMGCITAWFGSNDYYLTNPKVKSIAFHNGLDIDCKPTINPPNESTPTPQPDGSPISKVSLGTVRAISSGTVYIVENIPDPYMGKYVAIDHGSWASMYWHLDNIDETMQKQGKGYQVQAGTPIGIMGQTGNADGDHLHLVAFWWPPDKESAKKIYTVPTGAILINLNQSNIDRCEATKNKFDIDWSYYWVQFTNNVKVTTNKETWTGTSFNVCKENKDQTCTCSKDQ